MADFSVKFQSSPEFVPVFGEVHRVSDGGYEKGLADGYANGKAEGLTEGYAKGETEGYTKGYGEGEEKGHADGYTEGEEAGYKSGYAQGDLDGQEKGKAEGQEIGYADALDKRTDLVVTENGEYPLPEDSTGFKSVSVNVPNKLAQVSDNSITEITAEDLKGATKINEHALRNLTNLTHVEIPEGVEHIGESAFRSDSYLKSIELPSTLKQIGNFAISYCPRLERILIRAHTPPVMGSYVFLGAWETPTITVPRGCGEAYKSATNWSEFADRIIEGDV